ncbi:MAG: hypothetical protein ACT4TC_14055 [Myxococcaceae bacterium]
MADPSNNALISGSVIRSYRVTLEELKILEAVVDRLEPVSVPLLVNPPPPSAWLPVKRIVEILDAADRVGGQELTWTLVNHATLQGASPLLRPMIQAVLAATGVQPAALFTRLRMLSLGTLRGVTSTYHPETLRSGTVRVDIAEPVPALMFRCFEGGLAACFAYCKTTGTIGPAKPYVDGTSASYFVQWK